MPAPDAAAAAPRPPEGDYVRHPLLAPFRPSVLALLATVLALKFPAGFFVLHGGIAALVLGMYLWQFAKHQPSFMEAAGILLVGAGFFYVVSKSALTAALCILLLTLAWMVMTWVARRWPLLRGLTTLAVFLLVAQATLNTARPVLPQLTHAILDLGCISLLVLIAFASSRTWHEQRLLLPRSRLTAARGWSSAAFATVVAAQLLTPPVTSSGSSAPINYAAMILVMLVAGKSRFWLWRSNTLRWLSPALLIMPMNQVAVGLYFAHGSSPKPWMAMVLVLNGLAILALSLVLTAAAWAARPATGSQAAQLTAGKSPPTV